tara:strand:- start:419 stop:709 length:291 start_codon:yes stop_codon:yes gene_type:complete
MEKSSLKQTIYWSNQMGSLFSTPKPAPDPELQKQKAEQKRINEEEAARQKFQKEERIRKIASNKIGQRSLQSTELEDFTGFRRKNLSKNKTMGGSY